MQYWWRYKLWIHLIVIFRWFNTLHWDLVDQAEWPWVQGWRRDPCSWPVTLATWWRRALRSPTPSPNHSCWKTHPQRAVLHCKGPQCIFTCQRYVFSLFISSTLSVKRNLSLLQTDTHYSPPRQSNHIWTQISYSTPLIVSTSEEKKVCL